MLKIDRITKRFKKFELNIENLEIEKSSYYVLLGPTGSGKTLLMNIITGLVRPSTGSIFNNDMDITDIGPNKRGFGIVYQDSALFPHYNVNENIGFGLKIRGIKKSVIEEKVSSIMKSLGIGYLYGRTVYGLSGGEKQRIAIARALIMKPGVLFFDEPFSSLDYMTREDMIAFIKKIRKEYNPTIFHITHNFEDAMSLADKVSVIKNGSLIQTGSVVEVFKYPEDIFIANFVGTKNVFSGNIKGKGNNLIFQTDDGIDIFIGRNVDRECTTAIVRADDIVLSKKLTESSATNVFSGVVIEIINKMGINEIELDIGALIHVFITNRSLQEMNIKKNDKLYCIFKGSAVHLF